MDLVTGAALVQIIWINIILSGDNAMVIALACRSLSEKERKLGIVLGAGAAVIMRIVFTLGLSKILDFSYARAIASVLLFWIAVKLLIGGEADDESIRSHDSLWRAIGTIMVADLVMSLDNVVAIAGAAHGSVALIVIGLALSVPIVVGGSTLIVTLINRFPILVWIGSAFLGWIAGEMITEDKDAMALLPLQLDPLLVSAAGAALVILGGWILKPRAETGAEA